MNPPPRPGAYLWSIVAGPLVNVILVPVTFGALFLYEAYGAGASNGIVRTDFGQFLIVLAYINLALLIFNMLPIYPLDGGQTLRGILWYMIGPIRSLSISAKIGFVGAAAFVVLAFLNGNLILGLIAVFAGFQCLRGVQQAKWLSSILANPPRARSSDEVGGFSISDGRPPQSPSGSPYTPRTPVPVAMPILTGRLDAHCPKCQRSAPVGPLWQCDCGARFDIFAENARCPQCQSLQTVTGCPYCGEFMPTTAWTGRTK